MASSSFFAFDEYRLEPTLVAGRVNEYTGGSSYGNVAVPVEVGVPVEACIVQRAFRTWRHQMRARENLVSGSA